MTREKLAAPRPGLISCSVIGTVAPTEAGARGQLGELDGGRVTSAGTAGGHSVLGA